MNKQKNYSSKKRHTSSKYKNDRTRQDENYLTSPKALLDPSSSHEEVTNLQIICAHEQTISKTSHQNKESCVLQNSILNLQHSTGSGNIYDSNLNSVRDFFLHYLCHICKTNPLSPVLCKKCQMITYCSDEHRRKHWPDHMEVCEAIQEICKSRKIYHLMRGGVGLSPEEFRKYRYVNLSLCEQIVTRKLELWEREIFLHPNVCEICYEYDLKKLCKCQKCYHISFCDSHKNDKHNLFCYALIQYRELVQYYFKYGSIDVTLSNNQSTETRNISGFYDVLPETKESIQYLELSEIASGPLTALHALQFCCEQKLKSTIGLEVHLIGAESSFETKCRQKWEYYFLHLLQNLKYLKVVFIGPELNVDYEEARPKHINCHKCTEKRRRLEFQYVSALYHDYTKFKSYSLPGLICVFNPGLYRSTGYSNIDTWPMTIKTICSMRKIPLVLTAYTEAESKLDVQRVKTIQETNIVKGPSKNPFSSLKPTLNFITEHETPVIFKNFYYTIVQRD